MFCGIVGAAVIETLATIHTAVPPVLDRIVAAAVESAGNLGPSLAHLSHHSLNHDTFFGRDRVEVQRRLQVLVVTLAALLGRARLNELRDAHPVVGALTVDKIKEALVFGLRPRAPSVFNHHD